MLQGHSIGFERRPLTKLDSQLCVQSLSIPREYKNFQFWSRALHVNRAGKVCTLVVTNCAQQAAMSEHVCLAVKEKPGPRKPQCSPASIPWSMISAAVPASSQNP